MSRELRKSLKRKREETPAKGEESNGSNDSDDPANSDDGESTFNDEASTYGSASNSLGYEPTDAGSLGDAGMAEPRQHTNDESVERLGRPQQSCTKEITALWHEIAQLKEQKHGSTGELEKRQAEKVITNDEYEKAKECLLAAEKLHKEKEKEWENDSKVASLNISRLQNELEDNGEIIRKHESDLATHQKAIFNFCKQVQELRKSTQELQGTLNEREEEIRTLQSQLQISEASADKSLEEANAALKEARELNDSSLNGQVMCS